MSGETRVDRAHIAHGAPLWSAIDWCLWGNGLGDVLRERMADAMLAAIDPEDLAQALVLMEDWRGRRGGPAGMRAYEELRAENDRLLALLPAPHPQGGTEALRSEDRVARCGEPNSDCACILHDGHAPPHRCTHGPFGEQPDQRAYDAAADRQLDRLEAEAALRAESLRIEQETGADSIPSIERVYEQSESGTYLCPFPTCTTRRKNAVAMWRHVHVERHRESEPDQAVAGGVLAAIVAYRRALLAAAPAPTEGES